MIIKRKEKFKSLQILTIGNRLGWHKSVELYEEFSEIRVKIGVLTYFKFSDFT